MPAESSRGLSSVVSNVLLVGVVVALAVTVSVTSAGIATTATTEAPLVGETSGRFLPQGGGEGGVVRLTHVDGSPIPADEMEIVVDASDACGKVGRLVNLPAEGNDLRPESEYVEGEDVFDNSYNSVDGPIGEAGGVWKPGTTIEFRLASSECDVEAGEHVRVLVVHTPTGTVVATATLTA